jgi:hypothetical protein
MTTIEEKNMFLSNKEKFDNDNYLNFYSVNKEYLTSNIHNKPVAFPLTIYSLNLNEPENISLEEVKNIMNETTINIDEEEYEDIYFTKKTKVDLQSIDSSTKMITLPENKEEKFSKTITFKIKSFINQKRGRKVKEGNNTLHSLKKKTHGPSDFDNIQRKIQVSYITFLVRFGNDAIKSVFGKKTKYNFKDVNYELKKKVSYEHIEYLKQCNYSDIIQMKISPKNKKHGEDANKETFNEICQYSDKLKRLFEKNYLYIFQKYYCRIKNEINIDGIKIKLSPRTKPLFNLLDKNKASKDKFINVIKDVYFSQDNCNSDKNFIISSGN